jgi:Arc/MetJ family transcription regulator
MALCYTPFMKKRTTIWLDDADRAAIAAIKVRYGTATESDAIRLAVRLLAESKRLDIHDGRRER